LILINIFPKNQLILSTMI